MKAEYVAALVSILVAVIAILPSFRERLVRRSKESRIREINSMLRILNDLKSLLLIEELHCENNKIELGRSNLRTVRNEVETLTGRKLSKSAQKAEIERKISSMQNALIKLQN